MEKIIRWFKGLFLIGLILMFLSLFLDWYSFKIYSESGIVASWGFNLFYGWISPFSSPYNESFRPEQFSNDSSINFLISASLIIILVISGYIVFFVSIENAPSLDKYKFYAYITGALLLLVLCYIVVFPIIYLLQKSLYFPFFYITDPDFGSITIYGIGMGYVLQLLSFPLLFPYSLFYIRSIMTFEHEEDTIDKKIDRIVEQYQEKLDFDQVIAKEEAKL